jgi:hypothetical protein
MVLLMMRGVEMVFAIQEKTILASLELANNRMLSLAVDDYIEVQITCKIGSEGTICK